MIIIPPRYETIGLWTFVVILYDRNLEHHNRIKFVYATLFLQALKSMSVKCLVQLPFLPPATMPLCWGVPVLDLVKYKTCNSVPRMKPLPCLAFIFTCNYSMLNRFLLEIQFTKTQTYKF